ncbi:hypothetical protein M4951_14830 [Blastopirellula sp. J2-11]|uniref:hypothetical protein n=1 Tax=Blastopirellula sp. J2-11 TaxID=2943192 RepID=UPI0021CA8DA6|nr:hypothetical protein [Blastopirellula sp. J2-11]UUO04662.1 hypothetical protein M4951_14830 [Blastopirellula sp. J2-11]
MPTLHRCLWTILPFVLLVSDLNAQPQSKFRTDENLDSTLPWFQLVDGKFPPASAAHAISGELISLDHVERRFQIRVDRDDTQDKGRLDLPLEADMLPYGSIYYVGSPAALQHIPLMTHLHGLFFLADPQEKADKPDGPYGRTTKDVNFRRCLRLEDDFSFYARQNLTWKIDAVNHDEMTLTATLRHAGKPVGDSQTFDLVSSTRVFQGTGFAKLESIEVGQEVLFNLTWATLYGPGRIQEIWLDQASRDLATELQQNQHRVHTRDRGLAGWIDAVDDDKRIVTITFFDGVDPTLFDELEETDEKRHGWPFSYPEDDPLAPKGGICVARKSLMTYDPVNDRKGGNILQINSVPKRPGNSGVQIQVKCGMLLEGFRPGGIVRFYPATWKVVALPREEQYFGRE